MHPNDIITSALSPGSPLNPKNKVFRSLDVLAAFVNQSREDVLGILAGDLANDVACKVSHKTPGKVLVALKANLPANIDQVDEDEPAQIKVMGGPALNGPAAEEAPAPAEEEDINF